MTVPMPYIPPNIYLLADNLDAALAAGEDLLKSKVAWEAGTAPDGEAIARVRAGQRAALESVRSLEQMLIARILKSRERAEVIAKADPRFGAVARLYTGGTAILIEAVAEFGDATSADFENGGSAISFLRSRSLLAADAPGPAEGQVFAITEEFLVAHRIRLGTLLDLVAMFLDTLEIHYDLFSDEMIEPDLLPGEISLEDEIAQLDLGDGELRPAEDQVNGIEASQASPIEVDTLADAVAAVRNLALDQR
jgi:hypothetical protein